MPVLISMKMRWRKNHPAATTATQTITARNSSSCHHLSWRTGYWRMKLLPWIKKCHLSYREPSLHRTVKFVIRLCFRKETRELFMFDLMPHLLCFHFRDRTRTGEEAVAVADGVSLAERPDDSWAAKPRGGSHWSAEHQGRAAGHSQGTPWRGRQGTHRKEKDGGSPHGGKGQVRQRIRTGSWFSAQIGQFRAPYDLGVRSFFKFGQWLWKMCACRVLQDHTTSSGVQNQALDSLKDKLQETEEALRKEQENNRQVQVIQDRDKECVTHWRFFKCAQDHWCRFIFCLENSKSRCRDRVNTRTNSTVLQNRWVQHRGKLLTKGKGSQNSVHNWKQQKLKSKKADASSTITKKRRHEFFRWELLSGTSGSRKTCWCPAAQHPLAKIDKTGNERQQRVISQDDKAKVHNSPGHRSKPVFVFQSKDKLISSLKEGSSGDSSSDSHISFAELEECRQERDMYREELNQQRMTVESLRTEIQVDSVFRSSVLLVDERKRQRVRSAVQSFTSRLANCSFLIKHLISFQDLEVQLQTETGSLSDQIRALEDQLSVEKQRREDAEQENASQKQVRMQQFYLFCCKTNMFWKTKKWTLTWNLIVIGVEIRTWRTLETKVGIQKQNTRQGSRNRKTAEPGLLGFCFVFIIFCAQNEFLLSMWLVFTVSADNKKLQHDKPDWIRKPVTCLDGKSDTQTDDAGSLEHGKKLAGSSARATGGDAQNCMHAFWQILLAKTRREKLTVVLAHHLLFYRLNTRTCIWVAVHTPIPLTLQ